MTLSGRKVLLLSDSNRVEGASKCFRSVQPGYYFENGFLAHEITHVRLRNEDRLDLELDFKTVKDGILIHVIGDHTDFFLSLNEGQVTAELIHKEHKATIKAYTPATDSADCSAGGRRWDHAKISLTSDTLRLSVNHQPPTEHPTVPVVQLMERLTIGGGTAAGKT